MKSRAMSVACIALLVCVGGIATATKFVPGPVLFTLHGVLLQKSLHTYTVTARAEAGPQSVEVTIPIPVDGGSFGHVQGITSCEVTADPALDSRREEEDESGNQWLIARWSDVTGDVRLVRQARWLDETHFVPLHTSTRYPVDLNGLPEEVRPWLEADAWQAQSNAPEVRQLASELAAGATMQIEVVAKILGWIHEHVAVAACDDPVPQIDALWTLGNLRGICSNFANLALALLRACGIPARWVTGFVADSTSVGGVGHVWVDVYFLGIGWVEFESSSWVPSGALLVAEVGNNHFPETGVPATFLLPQHLSLYRGADRGVSAAPFDEENTVTITELERPREVTQVQAATAPGVAISWVLTLRSPSYYELLEYETGFGYSDFDVSLSLAGVPSNWYASVSQTAVVIKKQWVGTPGPSRSLVLTVIPPANAADGDAASIVLTASSGGKVVGTFMAGVTADVP